MRFLLGTIFVFSTLCAFAQTEDPPEVARAKAGIDRLRSLVEAGVAPRVQLDKAEAAIADAEDSALLRRTLYGTELNEDQADDMLAAAARRFDRRKQAVAEGRKLVDSGVASILSLTPLLEELDAAHKEQDLAESRAKFARELAQSAQAEELALNKMNNAPKELHDLADRYDGDGVFNMGTFSRVESEFVKQFGKPLPVSAMGETATHRSLGFDHRGRVDVAINPDEPEGRWLLEYLVDKHIPYFAFRHAVPGKATGAHIHLGPMSTRYKLGG
jgi:hypothetical protein